MITEYYPDVRAVIVEPGTRTGVPILTDNPKEVGADRIVNTLAAHTLYGGPCVVVDFGTSTNLDVVSAKGEFLGGALAPGIEISLDALASRAAALRKVELVAPRTVIGRTPLRRCNPGPCTGSPVRWTALLTGSARGSPGSGHCHRRTGADRAAGVAHDHRPRTGSTLIGLRLVFQKNR